VVLCNRAIVIRTNLWIDKKEGGMDQRIERDGKRKGAMMRWMFGELEGGKGEDQQNFEIET
jgi:hypothetical protein